MFCPTSNGSGESLMLSERSAVGPLTVVVTGGLVLSPVFGSAVPLVTLAVLVIDGAAAEVGVTTMVTVLLAPLANVPRLHVTVPLPFVQVGLPGVTDTKFTPTGNASVMVTPVAVFGPLLVTVMVYVRLFPTSTEPAEAVLLIDRSAAGSTWVVVVQLLLPMLGSATLLDTLAVLLSKPTAAADGVTTMVTVTLAPLFKVPMAHVTVPPPFEQVPLDAPVHDPDTYATFAGNGSVTLTPVAALGPLFVTRMLYVRGWPAKTGSGESLLVSDRLAAGSTVLLVVEELLPGTGSFTLLDTLAVLLSEPTAKADGVTMIVTVTLAPLANVPMAHVTVPPPFEQVPLDAPVHDPDTYVTFAGNVSLTVTSVAELGPAFPTVMVYVRF